MMDRKVENYDHKVNLSIKYHFSFIHGMICYPMDNISHNMFLWMGNKNRGFFAGFVSWKGGSRLKNESRISELNWDMFQIDLQNYGTVLIIL